VYFLQGILVDDAELKRTFSQARPYEEWLERQLMTLEGVVQSVPEEERQAPEIIGTLPVSPQMHESRFGHFLRRRLF
jgi:hypothetical protein